MTSQGYTKVLQALGSNIVEFLRNLNNLHLHLSSGQPAMVAPAFRVSHVRVGGCYVVVPYSRMRLLSARRLHSCSYWDASLALAT